VVQAVAQGNQVAAAVDAWLRNGKIERAVFKSARHDIPQVANLEDYAHAERAHMEKLPPEWRSGGFVEVELVFDEETAREEARRCLRCDLEWLEEMGEPIPLV
jgi:formate dehydrogenase major subunit